MNIAASQLGYAELNEQIRAAGEECIPVSYTHLARKLMKEGIITMREYGEKSFNPESLSISCHGLAGADNEPMSLAKRKLPQNILLAAYREPMSVRQLCAELGTPAAYIEDEVFSLVENQLMKEVSGGKYQTGFVILPGDNTKIAHDLYLSLIHI